MEMNERLKKWFETHECVSPRKVERAADIPVKTLSHFLNNRRELSTEQAEAVERVLANYGYKPTKQSW